MIRNSDLIRQNQLQKITNIITQLNMTNIKKSSKVNYLNMQLHPKNPQAETILNLKKNKVGASI